MSSISPTPRIWDAKEGEAFPQAVERYRNYLHLLARTQIGDKFRGKVEASDIAQQALLEAVRHREHFRGQSENEMRAWLRQILASTLADTLRNLGRAKRDIRREEQLQAEIDASAARMENWLVSDQTSPSLKAHEQERMIRVADALAQLPEGQRDAMFLRHIQGWKLTDIAQHLGISAPAVFGLLDRGAKRLRDLLPEE